MAWCCIYDLASTFRFISPQSNRNSNSKSKSRPYSNTFIPFAAAAAPNFKRCQKCAGKGAIDCPGCKGTGKNKKNGNIFERWKCFECQGFGLKSCPNCGNGGLTPEQRGER